MSHSIPTTGQYSIAARMDRLPITPLHVKATIVIGLGLFFDIYEIFLSGTLERRPICIAERHDAVQRVARSPMDDGRWTMIPQGPADGST